MKLLIDECLSPGLSRIAWNAGMVCAHVTWLGLQSTKDWQLVQRAVRDDWVFVTNNTTDFVTLVGREEIHPGLVCLNFSQGHHNNRETQARLFKHALTHLEDHDSVNEILEITLDSDGMVQVKRYAWPI